MAIILQSRIKHAEIGHHLMASLETISNDSVILKTLCMARAAIICLIVSCISCSPEIPTVTEFHLNSERKTNFS